MIKRLLVMCSFLAVSTASLMAQTKLAPVDVQDAWVRATVAGQQGTGGFMKLTAHEDLQLVRIATPVAGVAQIHEMVMRKDNVMEMRAIKGLDLPKGKTIELKSGGYHLMLEDLKQKLDQNTNVPLKLFFKNSKGQESTLDLMIPVSLMPTHGH